MWVRKNGEVRRCIRKFREVENDKNSEGIAVGNLNTENCQKCSVENRVKPRG